MSDDETFNIPPRNPERAAAMKKYLAALREALPEREEELPSAKAILDYLERHHIRNGLGRVVSLHTLKRWKTHREFPATAIQRSGGLWSSNYLILAWLWSYPIWQKAKAYHGKALRDR